ncbi:hypothetical protein CRG98_032476 [Punica granatum]|uniref:Uncharacterized protein n=1 Tax=Punica granatum TaxID=22663 RepID=A0A2I0IT20_PUNGR|nr:hypothetical protein CRG98_032476 [Punica granatum]
MCSRRARMRTFGSNRSAWECPSFRECVMDTREKESPLTILLPRMSRAVSSCSVIIPLQLIMSFESIPKLNSTANSVNRASNLVIEGQGVEPKCVESYGLSSTRMTISHGTAGPGGIENRARMAAAPGGIENGARMASGPGGIKNGA